MPYLLTVECLVEYDYEAQEEDELTIKKGEVITEVSQMEGGWWEGKLNGKHGAFPDNFVKVSPAFLNTQTHKSSHTCRLRLKQNLWDT